METDNDNFECVEKIESRTSLLCTEEKLERNEWMNTESFLPCFSNINKQKFNIKEINKTKELDKPGQSNRELNPYWKDGGNGLPRNMEKLNNSQIMDVNWLKKSLKRAEEQALRDNRSLEEVAAERWGSLEAIQSMIARAEKISNVEEDKSSYKRYYNIKNDRHLYRNSNSKIKNYLNSKFKSKSRSRSRFRSRSRSGSRSRSRSRSRTQENEKWLFNYRSQEQRTYQKPKDNNDDFLNQTNVHKYNNNRIKNWKKNKNYEKKCETISSSELERISIEMNNSNNTNNTNKEEKSENILTEAEMNKLGARIIKAELMGDNELAAELKIQLEKARKVVASTNIQEKTVILTKIDTQDIAIPIQSTNQSKQFSKSYKKKVFAEKHEEVCHFIYEDKYSLQKMFQHEKGISINKCEELFTETVPGSTDCMDNINNVSDQQIALREVEQVKQNYDKHKDSSKYMNNCWWCLDSKNILKHMIVTIDSMICISLPIYASLTTYHCTLTPTQHIACQLQLDEDVWEKLKEFKKKLINMFMNENLYPIFFEVYKKRQKCSHMQLQCIPLPKEIGELAPLYFKKALSDCEIEWSLNKKIIDLKYKSIRHVVPNGLSYFMVEFGSHPGYAHIIENEEIFPRNFAEEIIGGMLDLNCNLWRKQKKQNFDEQILKVSKFTKLWEKYNLLH